MSRIKETLLLNVIFPMADFFMGTKAMKWYRQINKMEKWSAEEIKAWQLQNLKNLIHHAYNHTVYYREVFDKLNLKPEDIQEFDDLKKLPILTKDIIRARFDDFTPNNIGKIKHRHGSTGGSTGEPFKYILDENTWGFTTAVKIYSWKKTGYRYGDLFLSLGSSSLFPTNKKSIIHEIYYRLKNTIPLNGMNMDNDTCEHYIGIIKKYKIKYVYGYASAVYLLALYSKKMGYNLQMKGVFTTSEKLTVEYRQAIESAWKVRVMDCYGARDGGVTAYEIETGYFNVGYNTYCETKDLNNSSELFCTNLIDFAFPLVRYAIKDEVALASKTERYNHNGQVFSKIIGRTSDVIELKNGHKLTTSGFNSMFRNFNLKAFRINKDNENTLKIEIQQNANYLLSEEELIICTMKKHAGEDIDIVIEYVDGFQPLKNGKRSFFMNEVE